MRDSFNIRSLQAILCLLLLQFLALCGAPIAYCANITTFDAPGVEEGAGGTVPTGITRAGAIIGYYYGADGAGHGFVRNRQGKFTTLEAPRADHVVGPTIPSSINSTGVITGTSSCFSAGCTGSYAFLRWPNGKFTPFRARRTLNTSSQAINETGVITGNDSESAFVRYLDGTVVKFRIGGEPAFPTSINAVGAITGTYVSGTLTLGFLRHPGGVITTFNAPGATGYGQSTFSQSINPSGAITGSYTDADLSPHGFLRNPDASFVLFDPPDSTGTEALSINAAGQITGYYYDISGLIRGFVRDPDGTLTTFDVPEAVGWFLAGTYPQSINAAGVITGYYWDANGTTHGFIRTP